MKLYIKQKILSCVDRFTVKDENGQDKYYVEGELFSFGKKLEEWVRLCYRVVGTTPQIIYTYSEFEQRKYFCFYNYGYELDVSRQNALTSERIPLLVGLKETYQWYLSHEKEVKQKPYLDFIDTMLSARL